MSDNVQRKYGYVYDHINRLTDTYYQKEESPIIVTNSYNEHLTYDKNGNIQTLNRNGNADDALLTLEIDNLEYTYVTSSNQLSAVYDSTADPMGFKDSVSDGTDYNYDDNGNMVLDANKEIDSITYNHLNLPVTIDFGVNGTITYLYDATGRKVKKRVEDLVNSTENKTHYLSGGFQYKNHILQFVSRSFGTEGYVNVFYCEECESEYQYLFNYVYNYVDHLGNIRMSYAVDPDTEELKILEENHYYPFGLKHTNYNSDVKTFQMEEEVFMLAPPVVPTFTQDYKYKYNGKEWQDEMELNMYSMDMRQYDPAIARWVVQDPVVHLNLSPYNAFDNNPVIFSDPSGANAVYNWDDRKYYDDGKEVSFDEAMKSHGLNTDGSDAETPPDDIIVNSKGIVTKINKNFKPNKFFDENGKELFFNDPKNDFSMIDSWEVGDRLFFPISSDELFQAILAAGLDSGIYRSYGKLAEAWVMAGIMSRGSGDFTFDYLIPKYFTKDEYRSLEEGVFRARYNPYMHFFRFGDTKTIYNLYDAGNFMWGNWMGMNGFSYGSIKFGSQANEIFNDTPEDQRAIKNGYNFYKF